MNILFVVVVPFPFGDASSIRAYNLCKLMNMSGINVHVISDYPTKVPLKNKLKFCTYEDCQSQKEEKSIVKKSLERVNNYINTHKVDAVLTNARYDRFNKLVDICKKNNLKIYVESCEWYDSTSFKLGKLDPRFWANEKMIRVGFKKANGFISISQFLDQHNKSFGVNSVRIPTILDVKNTDWKKENKNMKIQLVYAGSLGKSKELLGPIIRVLATHKDIRDKIIFHIYGPSKEIVSKNIKNKDILKKVEECVKIHGRVPQTQIPEIMKNADFVFFMRPYRKSSQAGFPTKLGESMAVGTPIITNNTGDISMYLNTGENGFIIPSLVENDLYQTLKKICSLSNCEMVAIRKNARKTAEKYFDYRVYQEKIKLLFEI